MTPLNGSLVNVQFGGKEYPYKQEARCKVCSSPQRRRAEEMLAAGRTYGAITRTLPDAGFDNRNLADHIRAQHLPLDAPAVRLVAQQEAASIAEVIEPAVKAKAAHLSLAHAVVARVAQRLTAGDIEPDVRDALAAARLIAQVEVETQFDAEQWTTAMLRLVDAVRQVATPEQFDAIGEVLARDPLLQEIARLEEEADEHI